jgi:mono/diheme cytochrome c family protein
MAETAFFILGGILVVGAVLISVLGLRSERFPTSRAAVAGIAVLFAALVVATAAFSWIHAEEHQRDYAAELAAERDAAAGERAAIIREQTQAVDPAVDEPVDVGGEQVFDNAGCASCHTLAAAGAAGTVGPDLDEVLPDRTPDEIEQLIVDPEAEITPGFPAGVMPDTYGDTLSDAELEALVEYLVQSTQ